MFKHKDKPVEVKTYEHTEDFEKDAAEKLKHGYEMKETTTKQGKVNVLRTGAKFALGGVIWAGGRPSRQDDVTTVIWQKKSDDA